MRPSAPLRRHNLYALLLFALAAGCNGDGRSTGPVDGGPVGSSPDAAVASDAAEPWVNPGCDRPMHVVESGFRTRLEIDLSRHEARAYEIAQEVTVRPEVAGDAITLFGVLFDMGEASHPYSYDGQRVTFCTGPYEAGEEVAIRARYIVSEERQMFPPGSLAGVKVWEGPDGDAVGPYSTPFFGATWMLSPNTATWLDATHDGNVAVERAELAISAPEGWTVIGPGAAERDGETFRFVVDRAMPLYTLSFAASPSYETVRLPPTASGVTLSGGVFPARRTNALRHLEVARTTVDWMSERIGPFAWGDELAFAEIPSYGGGFEHTNAVWLGTSVLDGTISGDIVAIHEVVHHWWGNDVRIADWQHLWMNEGLTDWMTVFAIYEEIGEPDTVRRIQDTVRTRAAELSRATPLPGPLRFDDAGEIMEQIAGNLLFFYRYGAAFLEMIDQRLRRGFGTDLIAILRAFYGGVSGEAITTESFRDYLGARTGASATWNALFDEWVYRVPAPALELGNFVYADGRVSVEVRRMGGADQDLSSLELVFLAGGAAHRATVTLPSATASAVASVDLPTAPARILVDPDRLYILSATTEPGWAGPTVAVEALP